MCYMQQFSTVKYDFYIFAHLKQLILMHLKRALINFLSRAPTEANSVLIMQQLHQPQQLGKDSRWESRAKALKIFLSPSIDVRPYL